MTDQGKKSSLQALAAGFLGFTGVVGVGSLLILHHGGSADAPASSYAPVDADSGMSAPPSAASPRLPGSPLGSAAAGGSSPAPLLSDEVRGDDAPAAANSPAAAAAVGAPAAAGEAAGASPKLVVGRHLDGSASASSSAVMSPGPGAAKPKAVAKKLFHAPKLDLSKNSGTIASTVHYGVSDRSELMGRAAGPVYNFSGKSVGQQGGQFAPNAGSAQTTQVAAGSAQNMGAAIQQISAAQKQLDATDVSGDQKAQVDHSLTQAEQTAASAPAGQ